MVNRTIFLLLLLLLMRMNGLSNHSVLRLRPRVILAVTVATVIISIVLPSFSVIDIVHEHQYHYGSESARVHRGARETTSWRETASHTRFFDHGTINDTATVIPMVRC